MPGVTIGKSSILVAGSVVTRDVPPGIIIAGIPARQIGLTADLDAHRAQQLSTVPSFPSAQYERENLGADKRRELQEAIANHGGYFLT